MRLRDARKKAGLTQEELAERAGLAQSVVSRAEKGLSVASDSLARLAEAVGLAVADLESDPEAVPARTAAHAHESSVIPVLRNRPGAEEALARAKADDPSIDDETWDVLLRAPGLFAFDVPLTPALLIDLAKVVRRHRLPKR